MHRFFLRHGVVTTEH